MDPPDARPSLFELLAQDQLNALLGPVVRYVTAVLAERHPGCLLKVLNNHDEWFSVFIFFLERHYLRTWGASFSENFYGLKRRKVAQVQCVQLPGTEPTSPSGDGLSGRDIRCSLIFLVLVPYLRAKVLALNERLGGREELNLLADDPDPPPGTHTLDSGQAHSYQERLAQRVKQILPYLNVAHELSRLVFALRYSFNKTPFWRPSLSLLSLEVHRITASDQDFLEHARLSRLLPATSHTSSASRFSGALMLLRRSVRLMGAKFFESLKVALPFSVFVFKFLEWWYSSSNTSRYRRMIARSDSAQLRPLKPPKSLPPRKGGVMTDKDGKINPIMKGYCPLCRLKLVNSTAFPSGWVCCYKCAHGYASEFRRCPVTFYPTNLADLRKILG